MRLSAEFYAQRADVVAKKLLGKAITRVLPDRVIKELITETEAYGGLEDLASHASCGKTFRNAVMFGKPGFLYVYLIYGMYHCLNIVTDREAVPAAVLIRALRSVSGPGRVCRYLQIDRSFSGIDCTKSTTLWIEDCGLCVPDSAVRQTPRINVDYAGEWKDKLLRFVLKDTYASSALR